jgi:hypothetical protein
MVVLPAAVLLAAFTHYPPRSGRALTPRGDRAAVFIGLDNYRDMLTTPRSGAGVAINGAKRAGITPTRSRRHGDGALGQLACRTAAAAVALSPPTVRR